MAGSQPDPAMMAASAAGPCRPIAFLVERPVRSVGRAGAVSIVSLVPVRAMALPRALARSAGFGETPFVATADAGPAQAVGTGEAGKGRRAPAGMAAGARGGRGPGEGRENPDLVVVNAAGGPIRSPDAWWGSTLAESIHRGAAT